jgi:hypothetical protein
LEKKLCPSSDINNNKKLDESIRKRLQNDKILGEKEERELKKKTEVTSDQLYTFNKMNEMLSTLYLDNPMLNYFDSRVKPFELDTFPAGCDVAKCKIRLKDMFETTRSIKIHYEYLKMENYESSMMDFMKRLGDNRPETIEWYFKQAEKGDVNKNQIVIPYDPRVLHSYPNEPVNSEILTAGKTHVAVGFTDLGMIHTVKCLEEWTPARPLKWIGYEASAYCVAKTAVVVAMVEVGATADEILQVWYSAAWSNDTLKSFRHALSYLINSKLIIMLYLPFCNN